jgi:hypothetical protein
MQTIDLQHPISRSELGKIALNRFGNLVKAVVDLEKEVMVIDADLHADQESMLIGSGSKQADLWGINLYPEMSGKDFVEFDSMINLRPSSGNPSRGVEDPVIREKILSLVNRLVTK